MNTNQEKSQKPISGIKCDVTNCHYHCPGSRCAAGEIRVGPQYASTSSDTICATFKQEK